jgi:hypothetical protein
MHPPALEIISRVIACFASRSHEYSLQTQGNPVQSSLNSTMVSRSCFLQASFILSGCVNLWNGESIRASHASPSDVCDCGTAELSGLLFAHSHGVAFQDQDASIEKFIGGRFDTKKRQRTVFFWYAAEALSAWTHEIVTFVASEVVGAVHFTEWESAAERLQTALVHEYACSWVPESNGSNVPTEEWAQALAGMAYDAIWSVYSLPFVTVVTSFPAVSNMENVICIVVAKDALQALTLKDEKHYTRAAWSWGLLCALS